MIQFFPYIIQTDYNNKGHQNAHICDFSAKQMNCVMNQLVRIVVLTTGVYNSNKTTGNIEIAHLATAL